METSELIEAEEPIAPLSMRDIGFATMYIPSKRSMLGGWRLTVSRPKGEAVSVSEATKRGILEELRRSLGEQIINEEIYPLIETFDGFLSKKEAQELRQKDVHVELPQGTVYFVAFQRKAYKVQIVGEHGFFVSAFVQLPSEKGTLAEICRELLPTVDLGKMNRVEKQFSKAAFDNHLEASGVQLRTGHRRSGARQFYGLRVDVDLQSTQSEGSRLHN